MRDELDTDLESTAPIWAVFGDLMSVLLGAFVLILVGVVGMQLDLTARLQDASSKLDEAVRQGQAETQRREALESALAGPVAAGRVTLVNGRIGINGNVLFALNSAQLQPEGRDLLRSLSAPLSTYLRDRDEMLMVSGFTDDRPIHDNNRRFADNWELSAQRALTVTRVLIEEGVPASSIFSAAFGSEQPAASNDDAEGRAKNRRVEIAPVRKPEAAPAQAAQVPQAAPPPAAKTPAASQAGAASNAAASEPTPAAKAP
ncbi:OmpA family protein [Bordetella genomosp. 13]|uniref:OmpA family protein n=1 Tax=Bordetella genomosp. 13 TaxID=463040 RepID=UPI0011A0E555|nr:OmpA family protein [Bordetella genomosp. 13]